MTEDERLAIWLDALLNSELDLRPSRGWFENSIRPENSSNHHSSLESCRVCRTS